MNLVDEVDRLIEGIVVLSDAREELQKQRGDTKGANDVPLYAAILIIDGARMMITGERYALCMRSGSVQRESNPNDAATK
jgi:hypothetical protein